MSDRYELDTYGWPLIINGPTPDGKDDAIVAEFPLPEGSTGDDPAGLEQVRLARIATAAFNANAICESESPDGFTCERTHGHDGDHATEPVDGDTRREWA